MAPEVPDAAHHERSWFDTDNGTMSSSSSISQADTEVESATEGTPLLASDLPADVLCSTVTKYKVTLMCAIFLFIIDVSAFVMDPPMQQLIEDVICRDRYPDHLLGHEGVGDTRCKTPEIQKALAIFKSTMMFTQLLCPLLVQVPFGLVADKYGRRPVLFMAILGVTIAVTWSLVVLLFPDSLSIWAMVPGSLALFVGGGAPMAGAMVWTIIADVTPIAERAPVFYQMSAFMLILSAILGPLSAWLMSIDPWVPAALGEVILILGVIFALLMPETRDLRLRADAKARAIADSECDASRSSDNGHQLPQQPPRGFLGQAWGSMKEDSRRMWRFIFASPRIMILITCEAFAMPIGLAMLMYGLQYITARFQWDWSKATYVTSISRLTSCIMLLIVLPLLSRILTKNLGTNPIKRDLHLARLSSLFLMGGSFLLAVAGVPWMLLMSLIVFGFSAGYASQCRALITALVEPHMLATVNTTLSTCETVFALIGTPAVGWLLGQGIEIGGPWIGLPYMVFTIVALFIATTLFLFRIPASASRINQRV